MSANEIDVNAVNAQARQEKTPMTKIPSVEKVVEQLAQQEWLMIGDVPTAQHWLRKALTTYAKTVAEEAVRAERERIRIELGQKLTYKNLIKKIWNL